MPIRAVQFPTQMKDALFAAGLKTVGQVREISDEALLALPDFGAASVAYLRETLGVDRRSSRGSPIRRLLDELWLKAKK